MDERALIKINRKQMPNPPIWVVQDKVNFRDLFGREDRYISAWHDIVEHWLFEPARHLSGGEKVVDRGISLLMLELAFFEPFGSIITGEDSNKKSGSTFATGLRRFVEWLYLKEEIGRKEKGILSAAGTGSDPNLLYSFARCGLMHQMTMRGGTVFVDALESGKYSMTVHNYQIASQGKGGAFEDKRNVFLVDPWRLLPQLEAFLAHFVKELLAASPDSELFQNFKRTFERTIIEPGKVYFGE